MGSYSVALGEGNITSGHQGCLQREKLEAKILRLHSCFYTQFIYPVVIKMKMD